MISFGYVLIYLSESLLLVFCGLGIVGAGIGFAVYNIFIKYAAPLRNCWKYFPANKGLITGLIIFGYGSSALVINMIVSWYINPNNVGRIDYYPKEISDKVIYPLIKVPGFFIVLIILFFSLGTLATILTIPFKYKYLI